MLAHILYSGRVQGVGFRYIVQRYALDLGLKGRTKNLVSGDVEIYAQGPQDDIEQMCSLIERHFDGYIRNKEISFSKDNKDYCDFRITF
ncbi:MAG: acylphosphatase [Candidatus Omnitrophica bacterium]|nr:acylphosphatase [Candidatus Omnitrophota bacterium]MBU1996393.1 acylphosphatase [Candidatus Omnitrophota bacterium]MBU4333061.1 acylphosphatase [Candidatus Omnitrophota bacterium]